MAGLGPYSVSAYLTSYNEIAATFHVSNAMVQHTLTIYLFFYALSSLRGLFRMPWVAKPRFIGGRASLCLRPFCARSRPHGKC